MLRLHTIAIFFALIISFTSLAAAQTPDDTNAYIRVGQFAAASEAVSVTVNGETLFADLAFPVLTEWTTVTSGAAEISLTQPDGTVIRSLSANLAPGSRTTFAAFGDEFARFQIIAEDYTPSPQNNARVTVLHAVAGAPAVDVLAGRDLIIKALGYPGTFGDNDGVFTAEVPAGTYDVQIIRTGTRDQLLTRSTPEPDSEPPLLAAVTDLPLTANLNVFIAFVGTPGASDIVFASTPMTNAAPEAAEAPSIGDLLDAAAADGRFTTLISAFEASRLSSRLTPDGSYTLFAPTDEAFQAALASLNRNPQQLLADTELLEKLLLYHVVEGALSSSDLAALTGVETLSGKSLTISTDANGILLNESVRVTMTDIPADNGVIHVIDAVLIPPDLEE